MRAHRTEKDTSTLHTMLRRTLLQLLLILPIVLSAQKPFQVVWEGKFSFDPRWNEYTDDLGLVLGGDMEQLEMLDGTTGKVLWNYNFKVKHGVKKCDDWNPREETGTIEVVIAKGKDAPKEVVHLDYRTGQVVAASELPGRKQEKKKPAGRAIRSRTVNQGSCFDAATGTNVEVSYESKRIMSAMGGTELDLTVQASGGSKWSTNFKARVVRHLTNDYLPAEEGDVILNVTSGHGKVFVVYEGITCLDLATGKVLWNTTFDNSQTSVGLKVTQEIGRSAMPLIAADGVYICDLSKNERAIKKLDLNAGNVIWKAEGLKKDDIVSELLIDGNNLIVRFGGVIRVEKYIPGVEGRPDVYKVEHVFEGSTSIRAYATATGAAVWNTEAMELSDNFKKSECNIVSGNGRIMACGEAKLYLFDAATGALTKQVDYNAKAIGKAKALYAFDDAFLVEGEEGIARFDRDLGQQYATNTGKCLFTEMRGDAFIVWNGKDHDDRNQFVRFDPATGAILGSMKDCYRPRFDLTGDRFLKLDGEKVTLYRTN